MPSLQRTHFPDIERPFPLRSKTLALSILGLGFGLVLVVLSLNRIFSMGEDMLVLDHFQEGLDRNLESGKIPKFVFDFCAFFTGVARDDMPQLYFFGETKRYREQKKC